MTTEPNYTLTNDSVSAEFTYAVSGVDDIPKYKGSPTMVAPVRVVVKLGRYGEVARTDVYGRRRYKSGDLSADPNMRVSTWDVAVRPLWLDAIEAAARDLCRELGWFKDVEL